MDGFKHGAIVAEVSAGNHPKSADQAGGQVTHNISIKVGQQQHIELRRIENHLHAGVIDDEFFVFDVFILLGHGADGAEKEAVAQLHDVGFVDGVNFLAIVFAGVLKGEAGDASGGFLGNNFQAL